MSIYVFMVFDKYFNYSCATLYAW